MNEIWKDVSGYEGVYQISNRGRLRRMFKKGERLLSGKKDKDGYIEVILSKKQNKKFFRLHRLVADAFIENPENKPAVNHKDKNVQNNDVTNLEWVTHSENIVHSFLTGRNVYKKPVTQYSKDGKVVNRWCSISEAAEFLGISYPNISACCHGRLKTSGGYVWKYEGVQR